MHRKLMNTRTVAIAAIAIAAATATTGCASSSRTTLGVSQIETTTLTMGVGDALGASMFQEHARLAAADARARRALDQDFATVHVPTD